MALLRGDWMSLGNVTTLLESHSINYRRILHPPAGNTAAASLLRQHDASEAAKSIVLRGKELGTNARKYIQVVIPGDRFVNFTAIKELFGVSKLGFADASELYLLTGCVSGAVPPFSFNESVHLVADRSLSLCRRIIFNAGRLDVSIEISSDDYIKKISPLLYDVSTFTRSNT